jgi:hypothetical protein
MMIASARLPLSRLFAWHTAGRRRKRLKPGPGNVLTAGLTPSILPAIDPDKRLIDGLNFSFRSSLKAIENPNHGLFLPPLLHFAFNIALEPAQILLRLSRLTE